MDNYTKEEMCSNCAQSFSVMAPIRSMCVNPSNI